MLLFSNDYYFQIKVIVHFKSKTVARELPKGINSLGIALCLKQSSSGFSSTAFKNNNLRNSLIQKGWMDEGRFYLSLTGVDLGFDMGSANPRILPKKGGLEVLPRENLKSSSSLSAISFIFREFNYSKVKNKQVIKCYKNIIHTLKPNHSKSMKVHN